MSRAQALDALGQSLQSGDLAGAQAGFANLGNTFDKQNQAETKLTTISVALVL